MLVNYREAAHYPIDPARLDLVEEFRQKPRGPHSEELQKILHRMRWQGDDDGGGRYVLAVIEPGRRWMLARLPFERGRKVELLRNQVFTSIAAAEWAVFKLRWERITGTPLPDRLRNATP
jgi:hypothetical protein